MILQRKYEKSLEGKSRDFFCVPGSRSAAASLFWISDFLAHQKIGDAAAVLLQCAGNDRVHSPPGSITRYRWTRHDAPTTACGMKKTVIFAISVE